MTHFFFLSLFLIPLTCFILQRQSILLALLRLEAAILVCIFQTFIFQRNMSTLVIFILIIAACESAFGLTILVLVSRSEETDKLYMLKC